MEIRHEKNDDFQEVISQSASYLYSLAYRLTGSSDDAKDLVQESYFKAFKKWSQFEQKKRPIPWLRKICINTFIDNKRRLDRKKVLPGFDSFVIDHRIAADIPTPEDELLAEEGVQTIHSRCFSIFTQNLPLYQKISFVLIDIFDLSISETAVLIDKTEPATRALLHRARTKISQPVSEICSLVLPQNYCQCASWVRYADDAQKRRAYIHSILAHSQSGPHEVADVKKKLIVLFNNLPLIQPVNNWFEEVKKTFR